MRRLLTQTMLMRTLSGNRADEHLKAAVRAPQCGARPPNDGRAQERRDTQWLPDQL